MPSLDCTRLWAHHQQSVLQSIRHRWYPSEKKQHRFTIAALHYTWSLGYCATKHLSECTWSPCQLEFQRIMTAYYFGTVCGCPEKSGWKNGHSRFCDQEDKGDLWNSDWHRLRVYSKRDYVAQEPRDHVYWRAAIAKRCCFWSEGSHRCLTDWSIDCWWCAQRRVQYKDGMGLPCRTFKGRGQRAFLPIGYCRFV